MKQWFDKSKLFKLLIACGAFCLFAGIGNAGIIGKIKSKIAVRIKEKDLFDELKTKIYYANQKQKQFERQINNDFSSESLKKFLLNNWLDKIIKKQMTENKKTIQKLIENKIAEYKNDLSTLEREIFKVKYKISWLGKHYELVDEFITLETKIFSKFTFLDEKMHALEGLLKEKNYIAKVNEFFDQVSNKKVSSLVAFTEEIAQKHGGDQKEIEAAINRIQNKQLKTIIQTIYIETEKKLADKKSTAAKQIKKRSKEQQPTAEYYDETEEIKNDAILMHIHAKLLANFIIPLQHKLLDLITIHGDTLQEKFNVVDEKLQTSSLKKKTGYLPNFSQIMRKLEKELQKKKSDAKKAKEAAIIKAAQIKRKQEQEKERQRQEILRRKETEQQRWVEEQRHRQWEEEQRQQQEELVQPEITEEPSEAYQKAQETMEEIRRIRKGLRAAPKPEEIEPVEEELEEKITEKTEEEAPPQVDPRKAELERQKKMLNFYQNRIKELDNSIQKITTTYGKLDDIQQERRVLHGIISDIRQAGKGYDKLNPYLTRTKILQQRAEKLQGLQQEKEIAEKRIDQIKEEIEQFKRLSI